MTDTIDHVNQDPGEVGVLPDAIPTVTFDPDLGEFFDDIDFDYNTYVAHLKEHGFTDQDVSNLNVYITDKPPSPESEEANPDAFSTGRYIYDTNTVVVRLVNKQQRSRPSDSVNETNLHETKHAIDRNRGHNNVNLMQRYVPKVIGQIAGAGILLTTAQIGMRNGIDPTQLNLQHHGERVNIPEITAEAVQAALQIKLFDSKKFSRFLYKIEPNEIAARRAARKGMSDGSLRRIIRIQPKSKPEEQTTD